MAKRLTNQEFIAKANKLHGGKYDYSKVVYTVSAAKITVICPLHGDFDVTANNHVSQSNLCGCPTCGGTKKVTKAEFLQKARDVHGDKYTYQEVAYKGTQVAVEIRCPEHGSFWQTPTRHMQGRGCHKCGGTKRMDMREALSKACLVHRNEYDYSQVSLSASYSDAVTILCRKHGPFMLPMKYHVVRGWICPSCSCRSSRPEQAIADFLSQFTTVEQRNRSILGPKEIDIWLPEHNIGIEYHGLYWHTTRRVGNAHKEKWLLAQQAGLRLVQIFEDEWLNKQDIVKNRLLAFLGKAEKRDARKLKLENVAWGEAKKFLNATHIQGAGSVGTAYGLYEGEELVAVATFGKSRSGAMTGARVEGEYEVLRYASLGTVRGGFTRLFAQFKKDFLPAKVLSYCDLRYGTGGLYQAASFALDSITTPDYWWVPKGRIERVTRYAVQKHKLAKADHELHGFYAAGKTENQICAEAGWEKIHGVGNQKWVWQNKLDIP